MATTRMAAATKRTFGKMMSELRASESATLSAYAARLGITAGHLCDVEKDRRVVSAERASRWAKALGHSEVQFVQLAMQAAVDAAGLKLKVTVEKVA